MRIPSAVILLILNMAVSTSAIAGGLERSLPTVAPLFEEGRYLELSWFNVDPTLDGSGGLLDPTGSGTGEILDTYNLFGLTYKADANDWLSYAFMIDQPWGVNTQYPIVPTSGYSGTFANLQSDAFTGLLYCQMTEGVSIYSGVRMQSIVAEAAFPFGGALGLSGPYVVEAEADEGVGLVAGAAYEYPDLAFRLALTYYSEIEHTHATTETTGVGVFHGETTFSTPQLLNFEFQSGIAEDTLAFGSIRWVDWSSFAIAPPVFSSVVGVPLVEYTEDWTTYTLGVGRKINDWFTLAGYCSYEPETGQELTTLGPVDGRFIYGFAPRLTLGDKKLTAYFNWIELGKATNFAQTEFDDGTAFMVGLRFGWNL